MIGRMVMASDTSDANTGAGTEMLLTAGAGAVFILERAAISQTAQSTSEQAEASIRRFAIGSTGGDAVVEVTSDSTATISTVVTVEGTIAITEGSSTENVYYRQGWNVLSGFLWTPGSDDEGILADLAGTIDIAIPTTQTSLTWDVSVTFREFGT